MTFSPSLKAQIQAIQARIDTVAPTATADDVVMLAKAVEAVGGKATVFDIVEAGDTAKAEALAAISSAKDMAVEDVLEAAAATSELQGKMKQLTQDMTGLSQRLVPVSLEISADKTPLPDGEATLYLITAPQPEKNGVALPALSGTADKGRWHILTSESATPIMVYSAEGALLATIPPYATVFAATVLKGDAWSWHLARLGAPDSANANEVGVEGDALLLSASAMTHCTVLALDEGFLVSLLVSGKVNATFLRWEEGKLVAKTPLEIPDITSVAYFTMGKVDGSRTILLWKAATGAGGYALYALMLQTGSFGVATSGAAVIVASLTHASSEYFAFRMAPDGKTGTVIYVDQLSSKYHMFAVTMTIVESGSFRFSSSTRIIDGTTEGTKLIYVGQDAIDCYGGKALVASPVYHSPAKAELMLLDTTDTPRICCAKEYSKAATYYSPTVRFFKEDAALVFWEEASQFFWKIVKIDGEVFDFCGGGSLHSVTSYSGRTSNTRLVMLSQEKLVLVSAGSGATARPRLLFGTIELKSGSYTIDWSPWIDLPAPVELTGMIAVDYASDMDEMLLVQGTAKPMALTVTL